MVDFRAARSPECQMWKFSFIEQRSWCNFWQSIKRRRKSVKKKLMKLRCQANLIFHHGNLPFKSPSFSKHKEFRNSYLSSNLLSIQSSTFKCSEMVSLDEKYAIFRTKSAHACIFVRRMDLVAFVTFCSPSLREFCTLQILSLHGAHTYPLWG